jgi:hypothetical protein
MSIYLATINIEAPLEEVFRTISLASEFSNAIPHILEIEFLSEIHEGIGTKFRETRLMNNRKTTTTLEVTEFDRNKSIRIIAIAGGTTWDSLFSVKQEENHVKLTLEMEARPHHIFAKIMNYFIKDMLQKALKNDLKSVKEYCENNK